MRSIEMRRRVKRVLVGVLEEVLVLVGVLWLSYESM